MITLKHIVVNNLFFEMIWITLSRHIPESVQRSLYSTLNLNSLGLTQAVQPHSVCCHRPQCALWRGHSREGGGISSTAAGDPCLSTRASPDQWHTPPAVVAMGKSYSQCDFPAILPSPGKNIIIGGETWKIIKGFWGSRKQGNSFRIHHDECRQ